MPTSLGQPHRHQVLRVLDAVAQRVHAAADAAARSPCGAPRASWPGPASDGDGARPSTSGGRGVAVVERRRVDDRLERGAGLAHRLGRAVELGFVVGEAADHREARGRYRGPSPRWRRRPRASGAGGTVRARHPSPRRRPCHRPSGRCGRCRASSACPPARSPRCRGRAGRSLSAWLAPGLKPDLQAASLPFMASTTASRQGATSPSAGTSASGHDPSRRPVRSTVVHRGRASHGPGRSARGRRPAPCAPSACIFGSRVARTDRPPS